MTRLFFRTTLLTVLLGVANARGSARAEAMAQTVDPSQIAPELDLDSLPARTPDGRLVPASRREQIKNAFKKLRRRGLLPRCPGASDATVREVLGEIAALDQGDGCYRSMGARGKDGLADQIDRCPTQIRLICAYAEEQGFLLQFPRVKADDRCLGGVRFPVTGQKSTVRRVFPIPTKLFEKLSDDEILDLIAFGERKARASSPAAPATFPIAPPVSTSPAPPALPPLADLPVLTAAELSELSRAIDAVASVHLHHLEVSWTRVKAAEAGVLEVEHVAGALVELANKNKPAKDRAHLERLVEIYFKGKRTWLDRAGDKARMAAEARQREQTNKALKSPEQLQRESGAIRDNPPPSERPSRLVGLRRARYIAEFEPDAAIKAAMLAEIDEAQAQISRAPNPGAAWLLECVLEERVQKLGARGPPKS